MSKVDAKVEEKQDSYLPTALVAVALMLVWLFLTLLGDLYKAWGETFFLIPLLLQVVAFYVPFYFLRFLQAHESEGLYKFLPPTYFLVASFTIGLGNLLTLRMATGI